MTTTVNPVPGAPSGAAPGALPATKPRGMFVRGLEVFIENKLAIVGVVLLVLIFGFCFLGPLFYHTDQVHVNLANENLPPGPGRPLGTDQNGYDVLGRLMVGGQISLEVGLAAAVLATVLGHPDSTPVTCSTPTTMLATMARTRSGGAKNRHGLRPP